MIGINLRWYFAAGYFLGLLAICNGPRALAQVSFSSSDLIGVDLVNPTTLQFGPDGRLYVGQQDGTVYAYTIQRNSTNNYSIINTETILLIKQILNHDDNGSVNTTVTDRQVTGLLVAGTSEHPVLYISSSDPRIGAGPSGEDINLDTNSGIISKLVWNGASWDRTDIVRGLPRSEENHSSNGLQLDAANQILYLAQGGHTNAGSPSNNFAFNCEYALSGAILKIDLGDIEQNHGGTYDIPTIDDPDRLNTGPGGTDINDPFGGNDGLNQARLVPNGPVQIHSPGYRNIYDLVLTSTVGKQGRLYTIDNGANAGWGGHPENEGTAGVTNNYLPGEPGSTGPGPNDSKVNNMDNLHFVSGPGIDPIYGGHPNPTRANPNGAGLFWRDTNQQDHFEMNPTADWPPVPSSLANPLEGDFRNPGIDDGALYTWRSSTNGLTEYTATNYFNGDLTGDLLTASFDGKIYRIKLVPDGQSVSTVTVFASGFGSVPLDVTAQGTGEIFEGTVWVVTYVSDKITVFEPDVPPDNQAPNASFTSTPSNGEAPLLVSFDASASIDPDGSIVQFDWDFGDGTTASGATSDKTFNNAGTFLVTLTVTDNYGATNSSTGEISVTSKNSAPEASFSASTLSGEIPLVINLDASNSSDSDGEIVSYQWDFGNGSNGSGMVTSVTYNEGGTYTIILTVTDDRGGSDFATAEITAGGPNRDPVAIITASPEQGESPLIVTLDASESIDHDGTITSYNWDFGNGNFGMGETVAVVYSEPGIFTVQLIVIDNEGALATSSIDIEVVDLVLATDEDGLNTNIQVFPNPTSDQIVLKSKVPIAKLDVSIINISGQLIMQKHLTNIYKSQQIYFPISELSKGTYILILQTEQYSRHFRLIKQ